VGEDLKLAAHSTEVTTARRWHLPLGEHRSIQGTLEHDFRSDELIFAIDEVADLKPKSLCVALVAWSTRLAEPIISDPFFPSVGTRILVAKGKGIVPKDVSKLELRVIQ
jgi:hypothetical protein